MTEAEPEAAGLLERRFELGARGSDLRTEILAGVTTFLTMAYIVLVNPAILGQAGMPVAAVAAATCLAAGFACILMGFTANVPLALAPGMGLNAYFSFTVVQAMGVPWPVALGCVFISGVAFLLLTFAGVRQLIIAAIPPHLFAAVAGGIGLFIALIGLKNAGIVVTSPATSVTLGDLHAPGAALALFGLVVTAALAAWKVRGAILIGIARDHARRLGRWAWSRFTPQPYDLTAIGADRLPARSRRRARPFGQPRPRPVRDPVRLPVRRPVRQYRHPGRRHAPRRADRRGRAHPEAQPHPLHRFDRHHLRQPRRHQHRHLLCRERRRRAGGRAHRPHRDRHRPALPAR